MTRSSTDSVVAVPSANDPAGDQQLRRLLHVWSLTAVAVRQPGYYEELTAARAGTATTVPVTEAIPGWAMAEVIDYPDNPLRTFPTSDPNTRQCQASHHPRHPPGWLEVPARTACTSGEGFGARLRER